MVKMKAVCVFFCLFMTGTVRASEIKLPETGVLDPETAQRIALAENPTLAAAAERVNQAHERFVQARAAYLPSVDASASGTHVRVSESTRESNLAMARLFNPMAEVESSEEYYRTGVSAGWLLFDGFRRRFTNAIARHGEDLSGAAEDDAKRLLLGAVASAFYSAKLAGENIAIAKANEAFNQRRMKDAQARLRVGTGSLSDVLNFEVLVNSAKADLLQAENNYETAMTGLAALLGIRDAKFPENMKLAELKTETPEEMTMPDTEASLEYAIKNRPDILRAEHALRQAEFSVGQARSGFYPTISLSASVDGERAEDPGFNGDDFGSSVGVYLQYNLFSGGADRAKIAEAGHARKEAAKNLESARNTVASEVINALTGLDSARKQLELQRSNESLVRQNRDLVEKEYNAGQGSLVRLNEAQRNLIQAQSRLAQSRVALRRAKSNFDTATGMILEKFYNQD